jgi:hypothetical protein
MVISVSDDVEDGCLLCGDVVAQSGEWKCIFGSGSLEGMLVDE